MIALVVGFAVLVAVALLAVVQTVAGDGLGHRPPPATRQTRDRWVMPHDETRQGRR